SWASTNRPSSNTWSRPTSRQRCWYRTHWASWRTSRSAAGGDDPATPRPARRVPARPDGYTLQVRALRRCRRHPPLILRDGRRGESMTELGTRSTAGRSPRGAPGAVRRPAEKHEATTLLELARAEFDPVLRAAIGPLPGPIRPSAR